MEKLVPVKSCVLTSGVNTASELFNTAKITLALSVGVTGVVEVSVSKAGALPANWKFEIEGFRPSVSMTKHYVYDGGVKAFVETAKAEGAHRTERLVALGYVGVVDADLAAFSVTKTEKGKNNQRIVHLRRTAEGVLRIRRLPLEVEEAGLCLL